MRGSFGSLEGRRSVEEGGEARLACSDLQAELPRVSRPSATVSCSMEMAVNCTCVSEDQSATSSTLTVDGCAICDEERPENHWLQWPAPGDGWARSEYANLNSRSPPRHQRRDCAERARKERRPESPCPLFLRPADNLEASGIGFEPSSWSFVGDQGHTGDGMGWL